jgi:diguanylate cyclase (GGDEF)-like protein/putative nucleotidyltransferase with HDIG domain
LENFNSSDDSLPAKIFLWLTYSVSLLVVGAAVYGSFSFSAAQFVVLSVTLVIAALVSQHQFIIPRTGITLAPRELIIFWGTIWLGIPGGVLLAAGISAVQYKVAPKDKSERLFDGAVNIIAAFAAGSIFYLILKIFAGFGEASVGGNALAFGWLAASSAAMAFAHYAFSEFLPAIFFKFETNSSISDFWKASAFPSPGRYAAGVGAAFIFHLAFLQFGLYFGLVLLPLTVFGHFAYRLHLTRFAQKTKEITEASRIHLATVEALATAIDARDQVGIGHVRRTQIYAVGIGELLKLSADELEAINTGALLHDIGKLAVPDHILNKPGRLTPAEMEKTKIHASVGASILEKINFPYPVVPTVKHHHEWWDGSGYPENLKGDNIPLTARILGVADAYDTLRGARPYRPALARDEARRFLLSGAGTQFDPQIVDVFLRNLSKFEAKVEAQGFSYVFDRESAAEGYNSGDGGGGQSYVEQIKRANREVFTLYELARVFSSSLNLHETVSLFVEKIGELVPFDTCAVYLTEETGDSAKVVYVQGANKSALKNKRVKMGEGATGYALKMRKAVHNIEPGLDFDFSSFDLDEDYTAMASLPLIADEKLVGAVSLYSCDLENYEEEHMRLLETVSRIASDAIFVALQHAESESRALTDPMTNLPNARSLQMQFEKETARASRSGAKFQLLMLDLDGFKAVNDTFGHKTGDKLLKELARVMTAQLRDYDFLARYAGDEFVAIVPETDGEGITELSRRIEKAVNEFVLPLGEGECARVGISIGAACYPDDGETLDQIIIRADKGMYAVKAQRKQTHLTQLLSPPLAEFTPETVPCGDFVAEENFINEPEVVPCDDFLPEESFIVELDESHIISSAIN